MLAFDELKVNLSVLSLLRGALVVDELRLQAPRLHIVRQEDGNYDIADLLAVWLQPSDAPPAQFAIHNIQISGGQLAFDDRPAGREHRVSDLLLNLPFVSNLPQQREIFVEPAFAATIDGARFALQGRSKPFAGSRESEFDLRFSGLDLAALQPYLPASVPVSIASGTLASDLKIRFRQAADAAGKNSPALLLSGSLQLADLKVNERNGIPVLGWQSLAVQLDEVDPLARRFHLTRLSLQKPEVHLAIDPQGASNWQRLLAKMSRGEKPAASAGAETAPAADFRLADLLLEGGVLHVRDQSNQPAQRLSVHDLRLAAAGVGNSPAAVMTLAELAFAVDAGPALRLKKIAAKGGRLDLAKRHLELAEFAIQGGDLQAVRAADGHIDWLQAPRLPTAPVAAPAAAAPAGKPWRVQLGRLAIDGIGGRFEDRTLKPAAVQTLQNLQLTASALDSGSPAPSPVSLLATVNQRGRLQVDGKLGLQPLQANVQLDARGLPLLLLQPYLADRLQVMLTRGQLASKGEFSLKAVDAGWQGGFRGQVALADFNAVQKDNGADFLRWKTLAINGIDFRLQPLAVTVGEIALNDFYSRLIVSPEGRLNLLDIASTGNGTGAAAAPAAPAVAETSATAPVASAPTVAESATMPIRIDKVRLQGGRVNFSDQYVKPNYSVNLTQLGGEINGLSSAADSVAEMALRASYAGSAPVRIDAKLNPLAAKAFLDLKAEVRGVDLVSLSPYSGKYAGYNIEKGKLSLFVGYKLQNRQLEAENRLFLDQLTFGEKVDSPNATTLPVNLAIALLKNRRGEIDINLPISGSLDDPRFSLGDAILKVIVNLFVKAVTSPFALLGSLFGGGEELSMLVFEPGSSRLPPDAEKPLAALAKALVDRPALKLEITGRVDPEADRAGIKRVALNRAVRAEKRKEMLAKGQEAGSLRDIVVEAAEYPRYLQRVYNEGKFDKPRNLLGLSKSLPVEEMEKLLLPHLNAGEEEMRQLALRRAQQVQSWLTENGKVEHERLFLMAPKFKPEEKAGEKAGGEAGKPASGSRVDFSLR